MSNRVQTIWIANRGDVLTTYLAIHHIPTGGEWRITNIEIYADVEHTKLLSDDVQIGDFDPIQQASLFRALDVQLDRQARIDVRLIRLAIERMSMVAA